MKQRQGFVSNSSSSSFVIAFDPRIEKVAFLFKMLAEAAANSDGCGGEGTSVSVYDDPDELFEEIYGDPEDYEEGDEPLAALLRAKGAGPDHRFAYISADYNDGTMHGLVEAIKAHESEDMMVISEMG